jgi:hypothetical protein
MNHEGAELPGVVLPSSTKPPIIVIGLTRPSSMEHIPKALCHSS